jgi:hypothetical protein
MSWLARNRKPGSGLNSEEDLTSRTASSFETGLIPWLALQWFSDLFKGPGSFQGFGFVLSPLSQDGSYSSEPHI